MLTKEQVIKMQKAINKEDSQFPTIFNALNDLSRFRIFQLLIKEKHDICVTDVANIFGVTISAASQQLRVLELSGIVEKKRMGQMVCYKIKDNSPNIKSLIKILS